MSVAAYLAADRAAALARHAALPDAADGAVLFADISGFTPVTAALAHELGPHLGAEELAQQLNVVYECLIGVVHEHGGVVVTFSGDAITCWFDAVAHPAPTSAAAQREAGLCAVRCALALQQAMASLATVRTPGGAAFTLALKVAVAAGPVRRLLVGDPAIQQIDVLAGATLLRLAAAEQWARAGEVVTDAATAALLAKHLTPGAQRGGTPDAPQAVVLAGLMANAPAPPTSQIHAAQHLPPITLARVRPLLLPALAQRLAHGSGDPPTELRPVVALFVRFATLDYDDRAASARLDAYIRWVQAVLTRYGGNLLDVSIGDKGSYLYAAFGAPIAHENDPERALHAALDLLAPPPGLAWAGAPQIGITRGTMRTGVYGGSARRTYGVLGDAVNTAARLMQAAPGGQIVVSAAVQQVAADVFYWEALPPLQLKGKPQPLSVFRLLAARSANSETFYQGALVGREAEVERLLAAAQPVLHHQFAGVCYVSGEAGIGKSRLVYSARQRLAAQTPLLWMYCPSDDVLRGSLRPFVTFLKDYFRQSAQHDEVTNKARFADVLNRLIAVLSSSPTHNAPTGALAAELERTRSFLGALLGLHWNDSLYSQLEPKLRFDNTLGALATLIQAESMRQPVWLELEDAHWLDPDSQTLVASLCGALVGYPVVIVCAARPDDAGRPFAVSLAAHTPVCALDLAALAPESTRALATQTLDRPVSEELTRFVYERTGGNPFFAEQLLLDLRERGLLDQQHPASADPKPALTLRASLGGSASALNDVPDTLNSLLVARLDRLDEPVRAVVQTAAVLGREWALPVLAAMHAGDPTLAPKVRAAEDGRVWSPLSAHNYLFRHVLLRDAAYGMQERARLRSLHQRAAQAIEQEYAENLAGQYAALAYHYRMAEERERERYYARLGGKAAAARYANAEAVALLSRALELTPEAALEERWELLLTRERVYELQGAIQAQDHDLFALEALSAVFNQPARRIEVALRRANYTSIVGDYTQGEALCQQALALCEQIGDQRGRMAVFIRLGILAQAVGDYSRARDYCEQAVVLAQAIGDRAGECDALGKRGYLAYFQDDYSAAEADLTRALQIAQELGDQRNEGDLLARLGNLLSFQGRNAAARTYLQQALGIVRSIGDQNEEAWALGSMGALALDTGHYSEAQSCLRQALQISRASNRKHDVGYLLARLGQVAYQTGDLATAHEHYTQSLALALEVGDSTGEGWVRNMLSAWLYLQAQYDAAHTEAHKVVQIGQAISDHAVHAAGLTSLGQALVQLGQLDAAEQAYAQALHLRQQIGLPHVAAESLAGLAALALVRDDLAQARLHVEAILTHAAAGVVFDGTPTPFLIELTCYEVLRAANDERAAAVLHAAYQRLMLRATALPDEAARRMFLDQVPCHRAVAAAWHEQQAQITQ